MKQRGGKSEAKIEPFHRSFSESCHQPVTIERSHAGQLAAAIIRVTQTFLRFPSESFNHVAHRSELKVVKQPLEFGKRGLQVGVMAKTRGPNWQISYASGRDQFPMGAHKT